MSAGTPGRRAGTGGRLLLLGCSILLALAAGEIAARRLGVDPHPALHYRFHPRYGWTIDPALPDLDNLQPSGFRTPPPDPAAGSRTGPRVLLLGDSFTVAVELPWRRTFAGIMAADLDGRGGALASLAAGGWGTAQEYLALLAEGLAWKPDVVVLQVFPFNDVCNNGVAMAWTCSWQDHLRPYFVAGAGGLEPTWLHPLRGRARAASRLFGLLDRLAWARRLGPLGDTRADFVRRTREFTRRNGRRIGLEHEGQLYSLLPAASQPPAVRQAWEITEALFGAVHAELAGRGIPLIAVVIPFSKTFAPEWPAYRRHRPPAMEPDHATRRSEAAFARLGVPVVSVRRRIEASGLVASELFNRRNRHLSAAGHRWTARWILDELEGATAAR
ncbi:MAG: hypothetical protein OEP45_03010 [Acidobacteriota bacterium]|nr:hypothetical protein [Acidobacteriota bacterium]